MACGRGSGRGSEMVARAWGGLVALLVIVAAPAAPAGTLTVDFRLDPTFRIEANGGVLVLVPRAASGGGTVILSGVSSGGLLTSTDPRGRLQSLGVLLSLEISASPSSAVAGVSFSQIRAASGRLLSGPALRLGGVPFVSARSCLAPASVCDRVMVSPPRTVPLLLDLLLAGSTPGTRLTLQNGLFQLTARSVSRTFDPEGTLPESRTWTGVMGAMALTTLLAMVRRRGARRA